MKVTIVASIILVGTLVGSFGTRSTFAQELSTPVVSDASKSGSPQFGVAVRGPRWVSVPRWFLNNIVVESEPLSTFGAVGLEGFWRRPEYDLAVGVVYQRMSPRDGNWLGKDKDPGLDADFVQARGLALLALDVSIVGRRRLSPLLSLRYGAGLGIASVKGRILRTSNGPNCTRTNVGDESACRPVICPVSGCSEQMLAQSEGGSDDPTSPSRFEETDVPRWLPVLNLNVGLELDIPQVPGLAARIEGGFYNAFVMGLGIAYLL